MPMESRRAVICAATLIFVARGLVAQTQLNTTAIDRAVISKLSAQFGINSKVITHLDLTQPFQTKSRGPSSPLNSLTRRVAPRTDWASEKGQYLFALSRTTNQTVRKRCF